MNADNENKTPLAETEIVYLGQREMKKGGLAGAFLLRTQIASDKDADWHDDNAALFDFKRNKLPRVIGGIYKAKCRLEDGRLSSLAPTYVPAEDERIFSGDLVAAFEARDKAANVALRARKVQDELAKDSVLAKAMLPLRRKYYSTDGIGRIALEVVVLNELRRGIG